jgi:hypothetical protein
MKINHLPLLNAWISYIMSASRHGFAKFVLLVNRPIVRPFIEGVLDKGKNLDSPGGFLALG